MIQQKHKQRINNNKTLYMTMSKMKNLLEEEEMKILIESEDNIWTNLMTKRKGVLIRKFEKLRDANNKEINMKYNEDWFINKTDKEIPINIQWLLSLGPKFALPNTTKTFPLFKCIVDGEECIQTIENREQQEIARTKLVSLIDDHLNKNKHSKRDKLILDTVGQTERFLKDNNDILILNSDKGNNTVVMMKNEYETKMNNIIGDLCAYRRLRKDPTNILQNKNNALIERLFNMNIINLTDKNKLTTNTATSPRIYGLPKVHKNNIPLRPICSSINSPSYELSKYLVDILKNLTKSSTFNVKDAIDLKEKLTNIKINDDEVLISFDVISLFPSVPVNLTLETIEKNWTTLEQYTRIPKKLFMELLVFCTKESRYFKYREKYYEQRKGMPMGSPASPVIADIIMEELLNSSLQKMKNRPKIVSKYVDDLFAIVKRDEVDITLKILNSFNGQIQFTMEMEKDNKLPYLDAIIIRHGEKLKLDWYQKPMCSGRLINFYSKHPRKIIINTATNFITRVLSISDQSFHSNNVNKIRNILKKNDFPTKTINDLVNQVKSKNNNENIKIIKSPKIYKTSIYVPGFSERLKQSDIYNRQTNELAFKTINTNNRLFSNMKSKLENEEKSNIVYQIRCDGDKSNVCTKVYVGTTKTKLKTRMSSHKSDIKATEKPLSQKTALAAHCAMTGHKPNFENIKILTSENNYKKRYTLEMLHIIDVPVDKRLNYKSDTERCAQIYRHTINKHRPKQKTKEALVSGQQLAENQ